MPRKLMSTKSNYGYKNAVQEAVSEGLISGSTLSTLDYQILLDKLNANQKRVVPFANNSKNRYALLKCFQRFQAKSNDVPNGVCESTDISIEPADETLIEANLKCFRKKCHSGNASLNRSVLLVDNLNSPRAIFTKCKYEDCKFKVIDFKNMYSLLTNQFSASQKAKN
ncbi:uncharacterized protein LOC127565908 [Drosophila albomicans]|uniref:Uncharacterized protein LOC127565908 n=1 Tax=Drosophila albomicans TaxID=7291 RepID=A0A9C6WGX9_DROAB|nr:uncharacterized protein LOC127565908 [Drosophila albomicans]